jgi:DNA-binding MarR family transcriptional regulator
LRAAQPHQEGWTFRAGAHADIGRWGKTRNLLARLKGTSVSAAGRSAFRPLRSAFNSNFCLDRSDFTKYNVLVDKLFIYLIKGGLSMSNRQSTELTQELFQILKRFSRLKWEQSPFQDLKRSECEFLVVLYLNLSINPQSMTASELSGQLQITPAGVTHLLNPLEETGYIERLQDPNDRRVVLIGLTTKGKELARLFIAEAHEKLVGLVESLGQDDSRSLIRLMSATIEYLETASNQK